MNILIPIEIHGVPSKEQAEAICADIAQVLAEKHHTDMWIVHEVLED